MDADDICINIESKECSLEQVIVENFNTNTSVENFNTNTSVENFNTNCIQDRPLNTNCIQDQPSNTYITAQPSNTYITSQSHKLYTLNNNYQQIKNRIFNDLFVYLSPVLTLEKIHQSHEK